MHTRFLYESSLYPKQKYTTTVFNKYFPRDTDISNTKLRHDVCSVGFEPNPKHKSRLQLLNAYYASHGNMATVIYIYLSLNDECINISCEI